MSQKQARKRTQVRKGRRSPHLHAVDAERALVPRREPGPCQQLPVLLPGDSRRRDPRHHAGQLQRGAHGHGHLGGVGRILNFGGLCKAQGEPGALIPQLLPRVSAPSPGETRTHHQEAEGSAGFPGLVGGHAGVDPRVGRPHSPQAQPWAISHPLVWQCWGLAELQPGHCWCRGPAGFTGEGDIGALGHHLLLAALRALQDRGCWGRSRLLSGAVGEKLPGGPRHEGWFWQTATIPRAPRGGSASCRGLLSTGCSGSAFRLVPPCSVLPEPTQGPTQLAQRVLCKQNRCPGAPTRSAPPQIPGSSIPSICRTKLRSATPAWLETTQV